MWFKTEVERSNFETDLFPSPSSLEFIRGFRRQLASLPAGELVKLWFGKGSWSSSIFNNEQIQTVQKLLRTRTSLFSWVYGPGSSVARDLLYVKLPSAEKRRFVNLILACNKTRFPWLNSRIVHAMAFRQRGFDKTQPQDPAIEPWGPLYKRATIPKGRGKRYLWIPNPPLKRIQKTVLRLVGPSIDRQLATCVYGTAGGSPAPTFRNAAAHIGRAFIASFDIRDFFPTTRVHDILAGIQHLQRNSTANHEPALMVDPSKLPSHLVVSKQAQQLPWTHDAQILIARLGTRRGRLPQGSPLSPLLANAAFATYDTAILDILAGEFGKGEVRYTRYFDDLTISITKNAASKRNLETSTQVKLHCEELLNLALRDAPYRLQRRKNRCSSKSVPHEVTGLLVRSDGVDLNRKLKRQLRSTIHHLQGAEFVEVAKTWYLARGVEDPVFKSISRGHQWQAVGVKRRRISVERLATLMLRHTYPDLKVERLLLDWYPWQEILDHTDERIIAGRSAWKMIEWLLAAMWVGDISLHADESSGENQVVFQQNRTPICRVLAESSFDFFLLPKSVAIAVAEYWHYLKGLSGYLNACPKGGEFARIHEWRDKLRDVVQSVRIQSTTTTRAREIECDVVPDTIGRRIEDLLERVVAEYNEFARRIHCPKDGSLGTRQARFRSEVTDKDSFESWISVVSEMFVYRLPRLPDIPAAGKRSVPSGELYDYFRVKYDQLKSRVSPKYKIVENIESKFELGKVTTNIFRNAQHTILSELLRYFEQSTKRRRECEGVENIWHDGLKDNPWHLSMEKQLENQVVRVEKLYDQLRSTDTVVNLFVRSGGDAFVTKRELLTTFAFNSTNDETWDQLFLVSKTLHSSLFEDIEPLQCPSEPNDDEKINIEDWKRRQVWKGLQRLEPSELKRCLGLIERMRNREAHGKSADRREEWVWIQRRVSEMLGRTWESKAGPKHTEFHADCDLELSAYEGAVVKVGLLTAVGEWLTMLQSSQKWRHVD